MYLLVKPMNIHMNGDVINPRRAYTARVTVLGLSVCYHVFCHHVQGDNKRAIPIGSALHWLDFKFGDFRKITVFENYAVKNK